jgi:hypothetical protein
LKCNLLFSQTLREGYEEITNPAPTDHVEYQQSLMNEFFKVNSLLCRFYVTL